MSDRKNIFLIGRHGNRGNEDQLTEMLAYLWQEEPDPLHAWFAALGVPRHRAPVEVQTQFTIPSEKRPDVLITAEGCCTLVESKLGSGFGSTQVSDYLTYLSEVDARRTLILLTMAAEPVPPNLTEMAAESGIALIPTGGTSPARHTR